MGAPRVRELRQAACLVSRLVVFDKRGTGLSDPLTEVPTLEQRVNDVRAVIDAASVERAAFLGVSEGGPMSVPFAATHRERDTVLDHLRQNGRATVAELAVATGLSASACSRRLRRLENTPAIRGYKAIIDPKADGRGLTASVAVRLVRHQREHIQRFQDGARKVPEIVECHHVTGTFDSPLTSRGSRPAVLRALPRRPAGHTAQRRPAGGPISR